MKKTIMIWWIILLSLALVFGVVAVVLSVKKAYTELHYEQTRHEYHNPTSYHDAYLESIGSNRKKDTAKYGCGEQGCRYCNGQIVSKSIRHCNLSFYLGFVYYRILFSFWAVSLALTAGCVGGGVTLLVKWIKKPSTES